MYLVQVSLLLIGQQGLADFFRYRCSFPLAEGLCKFYANGGGKQLIQRQLLLIQLKRSGTVCNPDQSPALRRKGGRLNDIFILGCVREDCGWPADGKGRPMDGEQRDGQLLHQRDTGRKR